MENTIREDLVKDLNQGKEIGKATLEMAAGLPANSPIEVTFQLDGQGRLSITGRDMSAGGKVVTAVIETDRVLSEEELKEAIEHAQGIRVIG
jgi:molecular chaperone DnaK (HSP70)